MMPEMPGLVLVIDDDQANIEVLNEILEADYEVLFATNGLQALELARTTQPDLILLDIIMPGIDGFEVCERLKGDKCTSNIPVIFVTELNNIQAEIEGLKVGAIDYISKPISPPVVQMRVRNHIELKRARDSLAQLAVTDSLTGIANRRRFDEVLQLECERLSRLQKPLSLIMIDIDHFKNFNDVYGHVIGDKCLVQVAHAIKDNLMRPADLAARYGGEEFACILPHTDQNGAVAIAERIRMAVENLTIPNHPTQDVNNVTISLGVISGVFGTQFHLTEIIRLADQELYQAKIKGRNRVCCNQI